MNRRQFLTSTALAALAITQSVAAIAKEVEKIFLSDKEWRMKLSKEQYNILRDEGTEPSGSSPLNHEKREGVFVCAGCDNPIFTSAMKYESGTGWPSFTTTIEGAVETKTDWKILYPRTEYHCAKCGGHQGHVFKDGPPPTNERWCNNGLALKFTPNNKEENA
tara:strand:+ start:65952 stop:66440 length:489 start_codon:yes stop_codon:yes gene_type:complete